MKKTKHHVMTEEDFTELLAPKKAHHFDLPSEVIPEDENSNSAKETLAGMEYDLDFDEDLLLDDELEDEDSEEEDEDHLSLTDEGLDAGVDEALKHESTP